MSGECTMNNWWYICWLTCESSWGERETGEKSRSFGGCRRCVVKYLANDSPNHREEVREMGTCKLPGLKSYLMLTISAKELRASPFLPALAATAPGMWKGFGPAARCWWEQRAGSVLKDFLFEKSCKQGISSEVESSPRLLLTHFFFLLWDLPDDKLSTWNSSGASSQSWGCFRISWCLASREK